MTTIVRKPSLRPVSTESKFSANEIEAGRRLFARDWQFLFSAGTQAALPAKRGVEIAFAGRSNVGKSSLINALTGHNGLARTSNTPGRTRELLFFAANTSLTVVDMPGYGYAAAPKDTIKAWTALIHDYLQGRPNLARVYVLIDARHGLKSADEPALKTLGNAAVSHQIVLTKADAVNPDALLECVKTIRTALVKRPAAFPEILGTSARSGAGIPELRAAIARLHSERSQ
jgi:GTP-binding protein